MPNLIVLVGPPASGKSILAHQYEEKGFVRISQDDQGKEHKQLFLDAIQSGKDVLIDRMNFDKNQRARYLDVGKAYDYHTEIHVLHESREVCFKRCVDRLGRHPTILTEQNANDALDTFFTKYEKPTEDEADCVNFIYPILTMKLSTIIVDIDNTLSNADHREHFLQGEGKKRWKDFFDNMDKDPLNAWCKKIINSMRSNTIITLCSGRPDSYREVTKDWLNKNTVFYDNLFMRHRKDSRADTIVKEIIYDFEIKTRYSEVLFCIDDRKCVIDMYRSRGLLVLDCAGEKGHF